MSILGRTMKPNACAMANINLTLITFVQHISLALCFIPTWHYSQNMLFRLRIAEECHSLQCSFIWVNETRKYCLFQSNVSWYFGIKVEFKEFHSKVNCLCGHHVYASFHWLDNRSIFSMHTHFFFSCFSSKIADELWCI